METKESAGDPQDSADKQLAAYNTAPKRELEAVADNGHAKRAKVEDDWDKTKLCLFGVGKFTTRFAVTSFINKQKIAYKKILKLKNQSYALISFADEIGASKVRVATRKYSLSHCCAGPSSAGGHDAEREHSFSRVGKAQENA